MVREDSAAPCAELGLMQTSLWRRFKSFSRPRKW